jgi:rare lipoprotein A
MFFKVNTIFNNLIHFFDKEKYFFLFVLLFFPIFLTAQTKTEEKKQDVFFGKASYYDENFNGRRTANGEIFSHKLLTAAHPYWPFNTKVRVTNMANNNSVVVRINDRGPFVKGRHIDLSKQAAVVLGFVKSGVVSVKMEILKWGTKKDSTVSEPINASTNTNSEKTKKSPIKSSKAKPSVIKKNQTVDSTLVSKINKPQPLAQAKIPKDLNHKKEDKTNHSKAVEKDSSKTKTFVAVNTEKKVKKPSETTQKQEKIPAKPIVKKTKIVCSDADSLSGWCVQVGCYGSQSNADKAVKAVKELTNEWTCVQEIMRNDVVLYRVVCGKNIENSKALEIKKQLAQKYPDAFVTNYLVLLNSSGKSK